MHVYLPCWKVSISDEANFMCLTSCIYVWSSHCRLWMASVVAHLLSPSPGWNSDNPLPSALCYVAGIAILLGANISNSDLERAHHLLCDFYNALPELYNSEWLHSLFMDIPPICHSFHFLRSLANNHEHSHVAAPDLSCPEFWSSVGILLLRLWIT